MQALSLLNSRSRPKGYGTHNNHFYYQITITFGHNLLIKRSFPN